MRRPVSTTRSSGFTLVEILVVMAIIGVIASFSIVSFNSSRVRARDAQRTAYIDQMVTALETYYLRNGSYPTAITAGQPLSSGTTIYMSAVPSNPTPRTDGDCLDEDFYYVSSGPSYEISFCLGNDAGNFDAGVNICTNGSCKPCGTFQVTDIDGYVYDTLNINGLCWMEGHLKTRTKPNGTTMTNLSSGSERDCTNGTGSGSPSNARGDNTDCEAGYVVYTWAAAMNGDSEGGRGICPAGWHVATDSELYQLESAFHTTGDCNPARNGTYECDPAGTALKPAGVSGFNWVRTGSRSAANTFTGVPVWRYVWSSTGSGGNAWIRFNADNSNPTLIRRMTQAYGSSQALPVSCVKDY